MKVDMVSMVREIDGVVSGALQEALDSISKKANPDGDIEIALTVALVAIRNMTLAQSIYIDQVRVHGLITGDSSGAKKTVADAEQYLTRKNNDWDDVYALFDRQSHKVKVKMLDIMASDQEIHRFNTDLFRGLEGLKL